MRMGRVGASSLLFCLMLAGCAEELGPLEADGNEPPEVVATESTGGIRGVVVDQAILPIEGATVTVLGTDLTAMTDVDGAFVFSGLAPSTYFVEAMHPFYDRQQTSTEVKANVAQPPAVKIQLQRLISQEPYMSLASYSGYIFCSANIVGAYSEECGEGIGNPLDDGQRIGKNPNNEAGQEWFVDSDLINHMVVEQVWDPSLEVSVSGGGQFRTFLSVNWVCDPFCGSDYGFGQVVSNSPLRGEINRTQIEGAADKLDGITTDTRFTTFTYAADNPGLILEQPYEQFVASFYVLPAPEGWSFVAGDVNPYA